MSERYDPKKLKREWAAQIAAGAKPIDPKQQEIDRQADFERRQAIRQLRGAPRADILCRLHNAPWMTCTLCSKPPGTT